MPKGILLSDHSVLNDLYAFNLKAYTDIDLSVVDKLEEALALVSSDIDVIISLGQIEGADCPEALFQKVESLGQSTPLVVIGEKSSLSHSNKVYTLPPTLNIPLVVKTIAQVLGITAKDMAAKEVPDFYPIPLSLLRQFETSPCDVFVKIGRSGPYEFSQCLAEGENLRPNEKIDSYADSGVHNLYIPSEKRLLIVNQATKIVMETLDDPNLSLQDKIQTTEQGYDVVGGVLGEDPKVTPEIIEISRKCMESVTDIVHNVPRLKGLIGTMLQNKTGYLYLHSVMGTYVSRHIIKEISWGSDEHAEKLSFVFFFHDIFLAPIFAKYPSLKSEENLIFQDGITEKEKEIIINHARLCSEMVKNFPRCPMGADAIILQHHGTTNGMGFALDYKDDISPLAKVLIISEAFIDEIIKYKDSSREINLEEIIESIHTRFTKHTYKKIINCLETIKF